MKTVQERNYCRMCIYGLEKGKAFFPQLMSFLSSGIVCAFALLMPFCIGSAFAASFDCAKAKTKVEKIICASPVLSKLDYDVNNAYIAAKKAGNADAITAQQRSWLKERDACAEVDCIQQQYTRRFNELNGKQSINTFLRILTLPNDSSVMQKTVDAKDFLKNGTIEYPPYPDIWGAELPRSSAGNVSVYGLYKAANGDIVLGAYWSSSKRSRYDWLTADNKYVMTGLFSGKQWRTYERNPSLYSNNDGTLKYFSNIKEIPCPIPLTADDPDGRNRCYAKIDHKFPNGNRLLYVITDYEPWPFCHIERYFSYFALVAPDGHVLREVTPIVVSKTKEKRDGLGGDPPCEDLPGGKTFKELNNWTEAPKIKLFTPLEDNSFLLVLRPKYGFKEYLIRFDQNFTSRHPAFGKEIFMMDTKTLEKMGNIYSDPKRTIQDNALCTDRKIYEYLTGKHNKK